MFHILGVLCTIISWGLAICFALICWDAHCGTPNCKPAPKEPKWSPRGPYDNDEDPLADFDDE